jgi:hypothetical protein
MIITIATGIESAVPSLFLVLRHAEFDDCNGREKTQIQTQRICHGIAAKTAF